MNTTFLIQQHNKAIRLLEAIEKNEYFTNSNRKSLQLPHPIWMNNNHIQFHKKRIAVGEAIAERLQQSYNNIISKINSQEQLKNVA